MSETVKLIIEIPKDAYRACRPLKTDNDQGILAFCVVNAVADGIPLDDVKTEIEQNCQEIDTVSHNEYENAVEQGKEIAYENVLSILDNIGKGDSK